MANHKPLPDIPNSPDRSPSPIPTILSTEFRSHRAGLLRHAFGEVEDEGIAKRRDGWVHVFEEVLDQLSLRMSRDNWLAGLKKGRQTRRPAKEASDGHGDPSRATNERNGSPYDVEGVPFPTEPKPQPLERIQQLVSHPQQDAASSHLLLCVAPHGGTRPLPVEDSGFDLVAANIGCTLDTGHFDLSNDGSNILFGLDDIEDLDSLRLVGGTFAFKGLTSAQQHKILSRLLRFGIYGQLSMILEQHFLKDSHVQLKILRPRAIQPSISAPIRKQPVDEAPPRGRTSLLPLGFLNIFSRKSGRPKTPDLSRGNSIDLGTLSETPFSWASETGLRLRRFSFIGATPPPPPKPSEPDAPFVSALDRVERSRVYLSTSAGVSFDPPLLLTHLVDKEKEHPKRRVKGDEKVGLRTLLGWEGREAQGKGMSGLTGFIRHQEISILVSHHVPIAESSETPSSPSSSSNLPQPGLKLCGKPQWVTYCYFSHDPHKDKSLGEALLGFVSDSRLPCEQTGCTYTRGQHQLHLMHGSVRIVVKVDTAKVDHTTEGIQAWESCTVCGAQNAQLELSDGSWLFSFSKFLELLIYSPTLCKISPPLCEHTTPETTPPTGLPTSRFNIIRHFSTPMGSVTLSLSAIEDVFELRVPRIQIRYGEDKVSRTPTGSSEQDDDVENDKRTLRREIRQWWECVSDHVDKLEEIMIGEDAPLKTHSKALPRLPSSDDAYESFDLTTRSSFSAFSSTTTSSTATSSSSVSNVTPNSASKKQEYFPPQGSAIAETIPEEPEGLSSSSSETPTATVSAVPNKDDIPVVRLDNLRHSLQRMEQNLYIELAKTPVTSLNDVRRQFLAAARGTQKRLSAWKKKHLGSKFGHVGDLVATEPDWWNPACHAVPGVNIIVREGDWGSIIAFTLSSKDYHNELANLIFRRATSAHPSPAAETPAPTIAPSFFSVASGYRFFTSQSKLQPDPDQDDVVWQDMESYSAVITRKEHTRDPTTLLSIRDVLRKGSIPVEVVPQPASTSAASTVTGVTQRSKPDVGVCMEEADGQVLTSQDYTGSVEKLLHDLESHTSGEAVAPPGQPPRPPSVAGSGNASTISSGTLKARRARQLESASVASLSGESDGTAGKDGAAPSAAAAAGSDGSTTSAETRAPTLPPKDPPTVPPKNEEISPTRQSTGATAPSTASSIANTIASSLMRFVMTNQENAPPLPPLPLPRHHGLLNADIDAIDERPHIKYDWTVGKRLKFSCTIYYAKQFDYLRRRCGIDNSFVQSLSRSSNWAAEGGKSKSNFWKTSDDRFIIKTLVNAWNVADLQFLIDLAPSYFRYMESTANKATVLAKLFGFYTIEIRNLETGNVQSKVDLLVMENLFYDQKISKTFDLKGIQGRKVKPSTHNGGTTKTLFDGEWIEGLQKTLMLVRPHSKRILQDAIRSDAEFLAKSNIMDYSLLLGVDETKKEISCGLVDTIGSYTFAKTLEYKAKNGLQSGKEVTVMPPVDYQDRFVKTLEGYFVACPDKWSKPLDESMIISDPDQLPSVL
ncbi:hypothetical protein EST38_g7586 [Candolleomyces aberdarensis]|uniref:PIPK domain-containing protein n=1 Tax=Candolleomyces aberdarensis TaxID=2316362 RepID=A0A4Q2DFA2_9AGAR|nr:hypothetical protein EST38_g7586 [Candolleomyces aberdarensis]